MAGWGEVGGLDLARVAVLEHLLQLGQVLGGELDLDGVQRRAAVDGGVGHDQAAVGSPPGFPALGAQPGQRPLRDPLGLGVGASMARRTTATACRWLSWLGTRVQGR